MKIVPLRLLHADGTASRMFSDVRYLAVALRCARLRSGVVLISVRRPDSHSDGIDGEYLEVWRRDTGFDEEALQILGVDKKNPQLWCELHARFAWKELPPSGEN
jgi:hypothetical protein